MFTNFKNNYSSLNLQSVLDVKEIDREIWMKLVLVLAWTDCRVQKLITDESHLTYSLADITNYLFVPGNKLFYK